MTSEARFWSDVPGRSRSAWLTRDEPQMRPADLAALLKITSAFSSGWEVGEILDSLYDELQSILPFDRLEYAVVDDTGYRLITHWFRATYESKLIPVGYAYRRSQRVATEPKYRVTALENDMPAYARHRPPEHPVSLLVAEGMKSSLSCPLIVGDVVKGFLFFNTVRANRASRRIDPADRGPYRGRNRTEPAQRPTQGSQREASGTRAIASRVHCINQPRAANTVDGRCGVCI